VLLGKRGANVVLTYVTPTSKERADKVAAEVEANGTKAIVVQADVSKLDQLQRIVDAALKISTTGKIEILIHKCVQLFFLFFFSFFILLGHEGSLIY
jgi:NAD(P)-dependent dehydrogenase (short-subunit alcohol dehydrogenase family)